MFPHKKKIPLFRHNLTPSVQNYRTSELALTYYRLIVLLYLYIQEEEPYFELRPFEEAKGVRQRGNEGK